MEINSTIPPNLLQIIDDLMRDLDNRNEINKNYDSDNTDEDKQDDISHKVVKINEICNNNNDNINDNEDINNISNSDIDNDNDNSNDDDNNDEIDIDKNFNSIRIKPKILKLQKDSKTEDPKIVIQSQIHSIINS